MGKDIIGIRGGQAWKAEGDQPHLWTLHIGQLQPATVRTAMETVWGSPPEGS